MGRVSFALTSLVAALPAALLAYALVMHGFLKNVGNMSPLLMIMVGMTLALSGFVVLIPAGVMVFGNPKKKAALAEKPAKKAAVDAAAESGSVAALVTDDSESDILETSGEAKVVDSDADFDSSGEFVAEDAELEDTTAFGAPVDIDEFTEEVVLDDDLEEIAELDDISDEVILEDEDDEPKPKKKRR